jgi:hypothetical protein
MALNTAALQVAATALAGALGKISLHTAAPDATGSNLSSAGKQDASFTAAGGDVSMDDPVAFTGGAASGPCTHVGYWNAAESTFYGSQTVTGDQAFNAAGEYTVDTLVVDQS